MVVKIIQWFCPRCNKGYPPFDEDGKKTRCESCDNKPRSFMEKLWIKILNKI